MRFGIVKPQLDAAEEPQKRAAPAAEEPLGRAQYGIIEQRLGYSFSDLDWLERALTHRSLPGAGGRSDYERLEFVGDAVLDLAVAHLLLDAHPHVKEGDLSKMRAALVNTASLADLARNLGLGKFIKLSRGELANGGADRPSILADVLEAVIGAVYKEGGYDCAFACVAGLLGDSVSTVTPTDPKTELQEALHANGSLPPSYLLECTEGPEHSPTFISIVEIDGQIAGRGSGPTKKASQQAAAAEALKRLSAADDIDRIFCASPLCGPSEPSSSGE